MAISISNYVSISSYVAATGYTSASTFKCLLITPQNMAAINDGESSSSDDDTTAELIKKYNNGEIVTLTKDQASLLFDADSDTGNFASGYYGYVSPTYNSPTDLMFFKMDDDESPNKAFERANATGAAFTGVAFLTPTSPTQEWWEGMNTVAAAIGSNRVLVVNYTKTSEADDLTKVTNIAANMTNNAPIFFVYGSDNWSGYMPLAILGSIVFSAGSASSFMYRRFSGTPAVTDDTVAASLDAQHINYLGATQSNGETIQFLQRGYNLDGKDTTEYITEMWFRNQCEKELIDTLATGTPVPHNETGVAIVAGIIQSRASAAVGYGLFSRITPSDSDITVIQNYVSATGGSVTADALTYALSANGYYVYAYPSLSPSNEPAIAYFVAYGSGASVKFISGFDYVVR